MEIRDMDGSRLDIGETPEERDINELLSHGDPRPETWHDPFDLYMLQEETRWEVQHEIS